MVLGLKIELVSLTGPPDKALRVLKQFRCHFHLSDVSRSRFGSAVIIFCERKAERALKPMNGLLNQDSHLEAGNLLLGAVEAMRNRSSLLAAAILSTSIYDETHGIRRARLAVADRDPYGSRIHRLYYLVQARVARWRYQCGATDRPRVPTIFKTPYSI